MKFFFLQSDSLYKIFKTLEKIPAKKTVYIHIDPEHSLFENERRGKQIKEILEKNHIDAYFVTKTEKTRVFFERLNLPVQHQEKNKFMKFVHLVYLFFFNIKKFHLHAYNKKNYIFYIVFWFEVLFVLWILYFLYSFILPSTTLTISPSKQVETVIYNFRYYPASDTEFPRYSRYISIPFYTWFVEYKYDMSISTLNVKYLQNPSKGEIKLYNKTDKKYSFVPWTRFVTEDWLLFQTTNWQDIPAWFNGVPGEKIFKVKAMEKDENDILMWSRGNIKHGTKLYVKNLKQSIFLKDIFAVVVEDFTWWSLTSEGVVQQKDIDILSWKLSEYIQLQKKNIITQNFTIPDGILLLFNDIISTATNEIVIDNKVGEKNPVIKWHIITTIEFAYIKNTDLINAFKTYIDQRPSDKITPISIDKNSLSFFNELKKEEGTFIIPTKINVIQWYDFVKDVNWILTDIKTQIIGKNKEAARKIILSFPEISSVKIKISPPWYVSIPQLKSRIRANIE